VQSLPSTLPTNVISTDSPIVPVAEFDTSNDPMPSLVAPVQTYPQNSLATNNYNGGVTNVETPSPTQRITILTSVQTPHPKPQAQGQQINTQTVSGPTLPKTYTSIEESTEPAPPNHLYAKTVEATAPAATSGSYVTFSTQARDPSVVAHSTTTTAGNLPSEELRPLPNHSYGELTDQTKNEPKLPARSYTGLSGGSQSPNIEGQSTDPVPKDAAASRPEVTRKRYASSFSLFRPAPEKLIKTGNASQRSNESYRGVSSASNRQAEAATKPYSSPFALDSEVKAQAPGKTKAGATVYYSPTPKPKPNAREQLGLSRRQYSNNAASVKRDYLT
jgi:hypothetical protein